MHNQNRYIYIYIHIYICIYICVCVCYIMAGGVVVVGDEVSCQNTCDIC